jgi:Golgi nucleoside diphosphatase
MKASEIISLLSGMIDDNGDLEVVVSVDISTGDNDAYRRAFGELIGIENGSKFMLIAEGELNEK